MQLQKRTRANLKYLTPEEKAAHYAAKRLEREARRQQLPVEVKAARSEKQLAYYYANQLERCKAQRINYYLKNFIMKNYTDTKVNTCIADRAIEELDAPQHLPEEIPADMGRGYTTLESDINRLARLTEHLPEEQKQVIASALAAKASIKSLADAFEQLEGQPERTTLFIEDLKKQVEKRSVPFSQRVKKGLFKSK